VAKKTRLEVRKTELDIMEKEQALKLGSVHDDAVQHVVGSRRPVGRKQDGATSRNESDRALSCAGSLGPSATVFSRDVRRTSTPSMTCQRVNMPQALIDTVDDKLLVVAAYYTSTSKLGLFSIGLW
jgi:hypothetical protein